MKTLGRLPGAGGLGRCAQDTKYDAGAGLV